MYMVVFSNIFSNIFSHIPTMLDTIPQNLVIMCRYFSLAAYRHYGKSPSEPERRTFPVYWDMHTLFEDKILVHQTQCYAQTQTSLHLQSSFEQIIEGARYFISRQNSLLFVSTLTKYRSVSGKYERKRKWSKSNHCRESPRGEFPPLNKLNLRNPIFLICNRKFVIVLL